MSLSHIGLATQQALESLSSEKSPLQEEYEKFFRGMLAEYEVESPFELPVEKQLEFFNDIPVKWKERKLTLAKQNKIDAAQV